MPKLSLATKLACLTLGLTLAQSANAVTGGSYSTNPRYSPIVKIRAEFGSGHERLSCTGTFISPRHILTSGHCLIDIEKGNVLQAVKIDFGTYPKMDLFWDPNTFSTPHVTFHVHPGYLANPKATNVDDVGIVELDRAYASSYLKLSDAPPRAGEGVTITGYGCDKKEDKWSTDFKIGSVEIDRVDEFLKLKRSPIEICEGDSGGPALIETSQGLRIVGVAAYKNQVKGFLGLSKDRLVRTDKQAPNTSRSWIQSIVSAK